jgi:EpsI family protein
MNPYRALLTALIFLGTAAVLRSSVQTRGARSGALPPIPYSLADWRGTDAPGFDADTLRLLAADEYVNRTYSDASAPAPVGLYIAYYARQRPGTSIHSPLHCLPGTGWEIADTGTATVPRADHDGITVRRLIVQKDLAAAVVLYWYALHGRVIANEWTSKWWLLHDAMTSGRTDGALVRIVVPVGVSAEASQRQAIGFAERLLPYLSR